MRKIKIVADSSANVPARVPDFAVAPRKIIAGARELDKSKTSCPNPGDWLEAFGDADDIFCVTITSGLSGSYNAACVAKGMYEAEHSGRRVFVIDSLSAGPELALIVEKLEELIAADRSYEDICKEITQYTRKTGLFFGIFAVDF